MLRLFKTNEVRKQEDLAGLWDFTLEHQSQTHKLPVPACWETFPEFCNYRGKARYQKQIHITEPTHLRFVFKGVSHTADVYFDGVHIKNHYGAFTPFDAIVKNVQPGTHELNVLVDNSFGEHSSLHVPNDYFTYGGITRGVAVEHLGDAYIERTECVTAKTDGVWSAQVKVFVRNLSETPQTLGLTAELDGKTLTFEPQAVHETAVFEGCLSCPDVKEWFIFKPNLYTLKTTLLKNNVAMDDLIERIGFREVTVCGEKILLNNQEIFIKGFNRHEDHATFGCALTFQAMANDIAIMKDMNANTVRTSHYPNDELFLDLCDEHGLMVWEENHARGLSEERMKNPNFDQQCHDCIDEMVKCHFNHPSIILWGVLNECASNTEYGRACYEKQINQIKSLDTSRPVTFATHWKYRDISLDLADVVSWNLYFGWYENIPSYEGVQKVLEFSDAHGGKNKPVILSEFGAGGIPGYRDRRRVKWSEERQADILADNLETYLTHPRLTGAIIWQFCDCLVTEEEWFHARPRTKNNKGIVDEYRRPKLAYETVKEYFGAYRL